MRLKEVLAEGIQALRQAEMPQPALDAEVLLAHCLGVTRAFLYGHPDYMLAASERSRYASYLTRRRRQEPVAYIVGEKEFWSRPFKVDRRVLIPRPETEVLVEEALTIAGRESGGQKRILDVGTGSGAIGITMAAELPSAWVVATDISPAALHVAIENARRNGVCEQMVFVRCRGIQPISGKFHLILSNPPYIPSAAMEELPAGVRDYEPWEALDGGPEGWEVHGQLVRESPSILDSGGWLLMEIDELLVDQVYEMAAQAGAYDTIYVRMDYARRGRVIAMRRR